MNILAHRANLNGPDRLQENSLSACANALHAGFGLEIDLRRVDDRFLISHDPAHWKSELDLAAYSVLFSQFPKASIAVNVKELGYEEALIDLAASGALGAAAFYFDFELLEPKAPGSTQQKIRSLPGGASIRLASRLSDRGESLDKALEIDSDLVWADEFDELWLTQEHVEAVHRAGRRFFAISPELHGFDSPQRLKRWADFQHWGIDGLCTDFPIEAGEFFESATLS